MSTLAQGIGGGGTLLTAGSLQDWWYRLNFRAPGASTIAASSDNLFFWIFAISTFFFVLLMVLMVWFSFRYRKRPGATPERSPSHNTVLELSWSVIPTIILVWMFFEGFWGYTSALVAPVESEELVVTGQKWNWTILYPNGAGAPESRFDRRMGPNDHSENRGNGAQEANIFVVPEGRPVSMRMSSKDVIHSFWIPDFRVKFDAFPNRYTSLWFTPKPIDQSNAEEFTTARGYKYRGEDHWVFCAEYCGDNHSQMFAIIRVVAPADYKAVIEEWARPTGAPWKQGQFYWKSKGCSSCHTIDDGKNTGPTWKNMYGYPVEFSSTDGKPALTAEEMTGVSFADYVRKSVLTPSAQIVKGFPNSMPSQQGQLSPEQIDMLIAFMKHLSDKGGPDAPEAAPTGASGATGAAAPTGQPAGAPK